MFPRVFSYKNQASAENCQSIAFPRQNDYICMIQNYKKLKNMRKALILCGFVAAFLCLAQNANAQIAGPIHRDGAYLADQRGNILSNQEVLTLVGQDIYNQTYVGAQKQRKAGKALIWSGAGGLVGGAVLYGVGLSKIAGEVNQNSSKDEIQTALERHPGSAGMVLGGTLLMAAGAIALDAGIPLAIIGKKRLDWVADNYNGRKNLAYQVGATPNGVGIAVRF